MLHLLPNERLRDYLYNIENYYQDAEQILDASHSQMSSDSKTSTVSGKSTQKAKATSNFMPGNSITGKNPFAILKASGIPHNPVYPNFFTNLPKATPPFLPPVDSDYEGYTLVLDLDETLIHNVDMKGEDNYFLIRPWCVNFIQEMAKYYEVVIFTAAIQAYADEVID